jgi:serine/threonine-protein kinase RsbT
MMGEWNHRNDREELETCPVHSEYDIVKARQTARELSKQFGMGIVDQTRMTTAVSELCRNMYEFAGGGEIIFEMGKLDGLEALMAVFSDEGPGIPDIDLVMKDGYTSGKGMGYGLPGAKRLVDDFQIESEPGKGTIVQIAKWI